MIKNELQRSTTTNQKKPSIDDAMAIMVQAKAIPKRKNYNKENEEIYIGNSIRCRILDSKCYENETRVEDVYS